MSALLFATAIFLVWRCLAIAFAKPVPAIIMILTAALLAGLAWLARVSATRRASGAAIAQVPPFVGRITASPKIEGGEPTEPAADVMQQLTLRTTAEGGQELSGWLRMPVAVGQRSGTLHVAFCPPFEQAPDVQVEAVSGPTCRIKVTEAMPYGVRIEIKFDASAANEETVLLSFFAANESGERRP